MSQDKIFIAVAGNIGTGKTTLTNMLAERFGWQPHCEAVTNNPYLADFYKDMQRWSFPLQIFFLNSRIRTHMQIVSSGASAIQDRSVYEDAHIFARNLFDSGDMEARDYENYLDMYKLLASQLQPPHLVVYLRKSLPKLKEQIMKRGRDYEKSIPDAYLGNLSRYYDDWMNGYDMGRKLIIESDNLDFVASRRDFDHVTDRILEALPYHQRELALGYAHA